MASASFVLITLNEARGHFNEIVWSDLSGLEEIVIYSEERRTERQKDDQRYPRERPDIVGKGSRPYALTSMGQGETVKNPLENRTEAGHGEERSAQEGHREDDQTIERGHALMGLRKKGGHHPEEREHHTAQDRTHDE